jgi:subtilisin family serine protease
MFKKIFILLMISAFIFPYFSIEIKASEVSENNYSSGEVLVKLKNSSKIHKFKFENEKLESILNYYNSLSEVEYAEYNYLYKSSLIPSDVYFSNQNYLQEINATNAWNTTTGSKDIVIAIIDSGVDIDHPDLKNNIYINTREIPNNGLDDDENGFTDDVSGWDFITNSNDPQPKIEPDYSTTAVSHGTVVAGIAAAEGGNKIGIAGVSWKTKILPLRVLNSKGIGNTLTVAQAIDYAREMGVDIINLSFVGSGKSITLENSIRQAHQAGILVVAAAGNEVAKGINLDEKPEYPVCHDGPNGENWVLGVASIDSQNRLASFSNYGKKCIDLSTPGVNIYSTVFQDSRYDDFKDKLYESGWTGTSVSSPQVAGAAALIMAIKPDFSLSQIKNLIINNTDCIDDHNRNYKEFLGSGKLNIYASISRSFFETPRSDIGFSHIISSPAVNGGPHVRVFKKENLQTQFFTHDEGFYAGVSLSSGDIDNDGQKEVLSGLGPGSYPWIKIFDSVGNLKDKIVAYPESFRGGVEVALGDIDNDGVLDIISGAGKGGGPQIRVFDSAGKVKLQFFAFDKNNRDGLKIASGDVNGDGKDEIIAILRSTKPVLRIFNNSGKLISEFEIDNTYYSKWAGDVTTGDIDNNGVEEIVIGASFGEKPKISVFDYSGNEIKSFLAYGESFRGGVFVAIGDVDSDNENEIISGAGRTGGPQVRVFNSLGQVERQFFAYDNKFRGGVKVITEK